MAGRSGTPARRVVGGGDVARQQSVGERPSQLFRLERGWGHTPDVTRRRTADGGDVATEPDDGTLEIGGVEREPEHSSVDDPVPTDREDVVRPVPATST